MATDFEVLCFIHERLVKVHGEGECIDYMHALRRVIRATDPTVTSAGPMCTSLDELKDELAEAAIKQVNARYLRKA